MPAVLCSNVIETALSEAARKAFQMLPKGYEFQSETVRKSIEKGHLAGERAAKADAVLAVLEARQLPISDDQRARVLVCEDLETLNRWVRRAAVVVATSALFDA